MSAWYACGYKGTSGKGAPWLYILLLLIAFRLIGIQVLITRDALSDTGVVRRTAGNKLRTHRSTHDIRKAGWGGRLSAQ